MHRLALLALVVFVGCGQVKVLSRADALTPEDRLEYAILAALSPEHAEQFLSHATRAARADYLDWFWTESPFSSGLPEDMTRDKYRDRAEKAKEFFGRTDLLGDDRVKTYIRYGAAARETYEPEPMWDCLLFCED